MRDPYTVCGGLQDNDSWCGPSRTLTVAGSLLNYWTESIGPGDGMYVQIDPRDPDILYANSQGGNLFKVDRRTGEARSIEPYPVPRGGAAAKDHPYRFNWNSPIHMSPHDPGTVYFGGNVLFRTRDGGETWEEISPDLTSADSAKLGPSGGDITPDNTTAETHATIYTVAESPMEQGVIWVGTDDGNLHLTRNGGESWDNVVANVPGIPEASWVSRVEASRVEAGRAYVSFDRHRDDDMRPWVFRTEDFGRTWVNITGDLPTVGYVHVVREDPKNPDLIYVGTELGVFASWTRGERWLDLRLGLPRVAVRDILVHPRDNDLVIGTHGRSVFILDDVTPLQELASAVANEAWLFTPRLATRYEPWAARFRFDIGDGVFVGENPPYGAVISFYLPDEGRGATASSVAAGNTPADSTDSAPDSVSLVVTQRGDTVRVLKAERKAGITRVAWDLRERGAPPPEDEDAYRFGATPPRVLPGEYRVALALGDGTEASSASGARTVTVRLDPRIDWNPDLEGQHRSLRALYDMGERGADAVRTLDAIDRQLAALKTRLEDLADGHPGAALLPAVDSLSARVDSLTERLVRREGERPGSEATLARIQGIYGQIARSTNAPTAAQAEWSDAFSRELEAVLAGVAALAGPAVDELNARVREAGVPAIVGSS